MEISNITQWSIDGVEVIQLIVDNQIFWKKQEAPVPVPEYKYFYIQDISGQQNQIQISTMGKEANVSEMVDLEYSTNCFHWYKWTNIFAPLTIQPNQKIYLRGKNQTFSCKEKDGTPTPTRFTCKGNYNVGGDITTLLQAQGVLDLSGRIGCFQYLFYDSTTLINAKDLLLPATILGDATYYNFFFGCKNLVTSPLELPALTLTKLCYASFCTGCTNLTTTPIIRAESLGNFASSEKTMGGMFGNCPKVNKVEIYTKDWNENMAVNWLFGTADQGDIVAPNLTFDIIPTGASGLPEGWTLNGEKLKNYDDCFYIENPEEYPYDTEIKLIKEQPDAPTIKLMKSSDLKSWVDVDLYQPLTLKKGERVYLRGDNQSFTKVDGYNKYTSKFSGGTVNLGGNIMYLLDSTGELLDLTGRDYAFYELFNRDVYVNHAKDLLLPATTLSKGCYQDFFGKYGGQVSQMIDSPLELPALELKEHCYDSMFNGESITKPPIIKATKFAQSSCYYMFSKTKITDVELLVENNNEYSCLFSAFADCKELKEVRLPNMVSWSKDNAEKWLQGVSAGGNIIAPKLTYGDGSGQIPANSTSGVPYGWSINGVTPPVPEPKEFFIENLDGNRMKVKLNGSKQLKSSFDGFNWNDGWKLNDIVIPGYGKLYLKVDDYVYDDYFNTQTDITTIHVEHEYGGSCRYAVGGDLASLYQSGEYAYRYNCQPYCYYQLFKDETNLYEVKDLTIPLYESGSGISEDNQLGEMFAGCYNLNKISINFGNDDYGYWDESYYQNWVQGVSGYGEFYSPSGTNIPTGDSGVPSGWSEYTK